IEAARPQSGIELKGARVAVQGFGSVGRHAARFLAEKGAVLVAAADTGGTIYAAGGLDIEALARLKVEGKSVVEHGEGEKLATDAIVGVPCDIWIPAARPDVLRADNVMRLEARLVAEGANIPATAEAEQALHERGILVLPDFIANAGGVIAAAVEYHGGSEAAAFAAIAEKIGRNVKLVLEEAARKHSLPRAAATALAERRVREAMKLRRFG
ncbi:MAG: Glu/Leu/Phe/Val dehydrogenase, partial [Alphaproteobacteria bacterium]